MPELTKMLILTDRSPYPTTSGASIRTFNLLRSLAPYCKMHLLSLIPNTPRQFVDGIKFYDRLEIPDQLTSLCHDITYVPFPEKSARKRLWYYGQNVFQNKPWMLQEYYDQNFQDRVTMLIKKANITVVQAELLNMTQYLPMTENVKTIYGSHNVESSLLWQRFIQSRNMIVKAHCLKEYFRVKAYEKKIIRLTDETITVTPEDKNRLKSMVPPATIKFFPITIDTTWWRPSQDVFREPTLVFAGTLFWYPNVDGLQWFYNQVLPLIKQEITSLQVLIVGREPPESVRMLDNDSCITVKGTVPDMAPYLKNNGVFIVPLRVGGGMRVKILEAFARGMAVVSTSRGKEGIEAEHNRDILVADTAPLFAKACVSLLKSPDKRLHIGQAGRLLAEKTYHWQSQQEHLAKLYRFY